MIIACVLVTYNPESTILSKSISALLPQLDAIVIVDNSDVSIDYSFEVNDKIILFKNGTNIGIAKAQNIGIAYCKQQNVDFVLFMDQDSIASTNMIKHLIANYKKLSLGHLVGAIGAVPFNRSNNMNYQIGSYNIVENILEVDTLISSGSLIPMSMLEIVGGMDESLFIDIVDVEWCWRAKYKTKCNFYLDINSSLSHSLGRQEVSFIGKRIPLHSPYRMFFRFRNYFLLLPRQYVPLYWKFRYPFSNLIRLILCIYIYPEKLSYVKHFIRGVKEGFSFLLNSRKR